jgi:hypothetical protein
VPWFTAAGGVRGLPQGAPGHSSPLATQSAPQWPLQPQPSSPLQRGPAHQRRATARSDGPRPLRSQLATAAVGPTLAGEEEPQEVASLAPCWSGGVTEPSRPQYHVTGVDRPARSRPLSLESGIGALEGQIPLKTTSAFSLDY